jgi:hypothetical protein
MWITTGRRGTAAALLGFAALAISGSAAGATKHGTVTSAAASSRAIAACNGMAHTFQSDVFAAATARGAREATTDIEWRGAALKAASLWLRSGCLSLTR